MSYFLFNKHFINNLLIPITEERINSILITDSKDAIKASGEEEKYLFLVNKLVLFEKFSNLRQMFLNRLKMLIVSNKFNDYYNLRIARLICYLCRSARLIEMMHLIIYDILIAKTRNFHLILMLFVRTWSEPFEIKLDKISPLWSTILFLVKNQIKDPNSIEWRQLNDVLRRIQSWDLTDNHINELSTKLVQGLSKLNNMFIKNDNKFQLTNEANEYLASFQLLCSYQGWIWSKNELFQLIRNIKESNTELEEFLIILQAKIATQLADKTFLDELTTEYIEKLNQNLFRSATLESLLLLIPHDKQKLTSAIELWKNQNELNFLPKHIASKLDQILAQYNS